MITFRRLYAQCQSPLPHCSFLMPTQVLTLLTGFQYLRLFLVPVFVCNKSVTQNSKFKTWIRVHSENSRDYYAPWRLGWFLLSCDHRFNRSFWWSNCISYLSFSFLSHACCILSWVIWLEHTCFRTWFVMVRFRVLTQTVCMRDFNREEEEVYRTYATVMNGCRIFSHHESQVYVCKWLFESGCQAQNAIVQSRPVKSSEPSERDTAHGTCTQVYTCIYMWDRISTCTLWYIHTSTYIRMGSVCAYE